MHGKKILSLLLASWLLVVTSQVLVAQQPDNPRRPNVIFILADDLGLMDLGCYGNPYIKTANLDSLARRGLRFTHAYAASPVCSPSRAAILTGKHPARFPITNYLEGRKGDTTSPIVPANFLEALPGTEQTIATYFKAGGYKTGMVGKWHLGAADSSQPYRFGFDYERVAYNAIFYYNFRLRERNKVVYQSTENENLTDCLTDQAIRFINENKAKPFFLYLAHFAPHLVLQPKPQKLPRYYFSYNSLSKGRFDPQYAATVETLDDNIGRLMIHLDSLKLLDNTIIVFTSDNGGVSSQELGVKPTDNSPLREGKGFVYEGGIRIPLLIAWKGHIAEGKIVSEKVNHVDFCKTLLNLLGSTSSTMEGDGVSFHEIILHQSVRSPDRPMYWHYPHFSNQGGRPAAAVRSGDFKLVEHYETGKKELYNLIEDPGEHTNLVHRFPKKVKELSLLLETWRTEVNANMPVPKGTAARGVLLPANGKK